MKWKLKIFFPVLLSLALFSGFIITSGNVNATTAQATQATVDFWSSSSSSGQVQATVDLPWSASIGGSESNRQQFYLNNISMIYPISAPSGTSNVYGRLTMRFIPSFSSSEDAYFCDYKLGTTQYNSVSAACTAIIIYYYGDGSTYQVNSPLYFIYDTFNLTAYVDYNQPIPNSGLTQVGLYIAKSGNNDVYSVTNGFSTVLQTLVSDGSFYTNGSSTDISPIINQNNTIINQNQQTYDYLTDNTPPSADTSVLSGSAGWLPPGPVDSILNLPIQLVQGIVGVFTNTNTCTPIQLPLGIIDYTLEIPCMRPFFELAGVNIVWNTVGSIISAFLVYNTLKWLYKFVDDTLTFRENESTMWGGL